MPEENSQSRPDALEQMLGYQAQPDQDDFVLKVMEQVASQRRTRRLILWSSGGLGAIFGLIGASLLTGPISNSILSLLDSPEALPAAVGAVAVAAILAWFMAEDSSIFG